MEQKQILCLNEKETINGFNWSFCNALLEKLEKLHAEGRIVDERQYFTRIGTCVLTYLSEQTKYVSFDGVPSSGFASTEDIKEIPIFIENTREFLSIFKKEEQKRDPKKIDYALYEVLIKELEEMRLTLENEHKGVSFSRLHEAIKAIEMLLAIVKEYQA